jgi:hypothetical protein
VTGTELATGVRRLWRDLEPAPDRLVVPAHSSIQQMSLQVAVFGDPAMWGQGLLAEHQFARLAMQEIAGANESVELLPCRRSCSLW